MLPSGRHSWDWHELMNCESTWPWHWGRADSLEQRKIISASTGSDQTKIERTIFWGSDRSISTSAIQGLTPADLLVWCIGVLLSFVFKKCCFVMADHTEWLKWLIKDLHTSIKPNFILLTLSPIFTATSCYSQKNRKLYVTFQFTQL